MRWGFLWEVSGNKGLGAGLDRKGIVRSTSSDVRAAPHPYPLPVKNGEREASALALKYPLSDVTPLGHHPDLRYGSGHSSFELPHAHSSPRPARAGWLKRATSNGIRGGKPRGGKPHKTGVCASPKRWHGSSVVLVGKFGDKWWSSRRGGSSGPYRSGLTVLVKLARAVANMLHVRTERNWSLACASPSPFLPPLPRLLARRAMHRTPYRAIIRQASAIIDALGTPR